MNQYKSVVIYLLISFSLSICCSAETIKIGGTTFSLAQLEVGLGESSIAVFDFNSDGHQDVIIANYSENNLVTYQGNSEGGLIQSSHFSAGENPTGIATADINGDGNIDVVIANHETSYVTLLYGDGRGGFKPAPHSPLNIDVKPHLHEVQLQDLDGDNHVDLIVDSRDQQGLLVLKGLGNGTFATPGTLINVGGDPYLGFAAGDINGDGRLDLLTPNSNEVGIVINTNSDDFSFTLNKLASETPFAVELVDINADGKLDLIVASNSKHVTVIPGGGNGYFLEEKKTLISTTVGAKQIAVGDINGDGIEDVLVSNWSGEILAVLGSKTAFETVSFEHSSIPNPWGVVLADLNKDGKSDFIITDGERKLAAVYTSQGN